MHTIKNRKRGILGDVDVRIGIGMEGWKIFGFIEGLKRSRWKIKNYF